MLLRSIAGDPTYGNGTSRRGPEGTTRLFLHAWKIVFAHPRDGRLMRLEAELPVDLRTPLREGREIDSLIRSHWIQRRDQGAVERLALRESRKPFASVQELRAEPHLEMHTRGG